MTAPQVRAVVVSWNGAHLLPACLSSLAAQTGDFELEVLVVDNASSDDTPRVLATHPGVASVRTAANLGFAGGAALGTQDYGGDAVLLLNNDATLEPGALDRMVGELMAPGNERVGAVTAKILLDGWFRALPATSASPAPRTFRRAETDFDPVDGGTPGAIRVVNSTGNVVTRRGRGTDRDWLAADGTEVGAREVMGFCGGAALLRRTALAQVGGFDSWLFLYYEDTDVSWKMRAAGWRIVYLPTAVALHRHAASSDASSPLFRYYNTRNSLVVIGRHAPWPVVGRAAARQTGGWLLSLLRPREPAAVRAARGRGLRDALLRSPRTLVERRRVWQSAVVTRAEVGRFLL